MPQIKLLPQNLINQIAAGEVLERPASALKEVLENAIDAGAENIKVAIEAGGKNLISIEDDGCGMSRDELELAIQRHATSKLEDDDLLNINFFGFRGEALPAIGSVAKLKIISKKDGEDAWQVEVVGGNNSQPEPANFWHNGTKVEIRDLFFATPARLKFMKTENTEKQRIVDMFKKIAMANPSVSLELKNDDKIKFNFPQEKLLERVNKVIGNEFEDNALEVNAERENMSLRGYVCVPTFNRGTSEEQYVFVNGRPVKDKVLLGAIKGAYADFLGGGRFPVLALFINVPSNEVDVNVHPAKSEVRFRDSRAVTGMLVSAIREAIGAAGHRASTTIADFAMNAIQKTNPQSSMSFSRSSSQPSYQSSYYSPQTAQSNVAYESVAEESASYDTPQDQPQDDYPLGNAKAQLHATYIISETEDSIVIVDQHAAHERLVYEKYKRQLEEERIEKQPLLVPEVIKLDEKRFEAILSIKPELERYGFEIEKFGVDEIVVNQVPGLLGGYKIAQLISDIADDVIEHGEGLSLIESFEHILETAACHNSIRSGRRLSPQEMDEMLRQMEATPHSGQCNHGRPTYVELKLSDIEKLFGRR